MKSIVHTALDQMADSYLPDAKDRDIRYNPDDKLKFVKKTKDDERPPYGTYYLSLWCGQGHSHKQPVLSQDFRGAGYKLNALAMFLKHLTPLHQTIGLIFDAVNRQAYHNYLRVFHRQLDLNAADVLHTSKRMCFMGIAVNRNNRVIPHVDRHDV